MVPANHYEVPSLVLTGCPVALIVSYPEATRRRELPGSYTRLGQIGDSARCT